MDGAWTDPLAFPGCAIPCRQQHTEDIRKAGVKAPVGTVQRMTEWVMDDPSLDRLAEACDVIGTFQPTSYGLKAESWLVGVCVRSSKQTKHISSSPIVSAPSTIKQV